MQDFRALSGSLTGMVFTKLITRVPTAIATQIWREEESNIFSIQISKY